MTNTKSNVGSHLIHWLQQKGWKKVITGRNEIMSVGDHDITKLYIIPSVDILIDIPDNINGSFYRGQVCIGFKNDIQPSSAMRHASELNQVLQNQSDLIKPVLLLC